MNFYFEAAKTLDRLDAKVGSIKGVIGTLPEKDRKRTAALVIETLKYKSVLIEVINAAKLMVDERKTLTSINLALVLAHDHLFAGGIQAGDGPVKQAILRHKTRLHSELQKIKIKRGVVSDANLVANADDRAVQIPRYVRINTLVWSLEEALESFTGRGFILASPFESETGFTKDAHIPNLLAFAPKATFHNDPMYTTGKIILQDKASCFPAVILDPPASDNAVVIDATAAPGNKTSHLSALMKNRGKLYAFERDKKRFATLTTMLSRAGCKNVEALNVDFLTLDPSDLQYQTVTHILLDPSCSGSGIVNRLDYLLDHDNEASMESDRDDRLTKLAAFQLMMVKHAMKFPGVQKIVYSTCSIHDIENEAVVRDALNSDEALAGRFLLAPSNQVLPQWHRRGFSDVMDSPSQTASLVRCSPGEDATNGFFVSCFVRDRKRRPDLDVIYDHDHELTGRKKKRKKKKKTEV